MRTIPLGGGSVVFASRVIKRRRAILVSGVAGLASYAAWRYNSGSDVQTIVMVLRKRLDYLMLDEQGVLAYARDLAAEHEISSRRLKALGALAPMYANFSMSSADNRVSNAIRHGEDRIVSGYLYGSDFFANGADTSKVVHYLGRPDPLRPCSNPFARPPL